MFAEISGAKFLELNTSAKISAMGESFIAQGDDLGAANENPAGLAFGSGEEAFFTYSKNIQDTNQQFLAGALDFGKIRIGGNVNIYSTPKTEITDFTGEGTGEYFQYKGTCYGFSIAENIRDRFGLGITLKAIQDEIYGERKSVFAADLGGIVSLGKWRVGASIENLGGEIDDGVKLPRTIRTGINYTYSGFSLSSQFRRNIVEKENIISFGAEYGLENITFLRMGYRTGESFGGFSAGLGIKLGKFKIDYAWVPHENLGNNHQISIGYKFSSGVKEQKEEILPVVTQSSQPLKEKISLAIMELTPQQVSSTDAALITDSLYTEVTKTNAFIVVERNKLQQAITELKQQQTGLTDQETAIEVGKMLNAQKVIVGSVGKLEGIFLVNIRLVDVKTSQVIWADKGKGSSLVDVTERVVRELALEMMKALR